MSGSETRPIQGAYRPQAPSPRAGGDATAATGVSTHFLRFDRLTYGKPVQAPEGPARAHTENGVTSASAGVPAPLRRLLTPSAFLASSETAAQISDTDAGRFGALFVAPAFVLPDGPRRQDTLEHRQVLARVRAYPEEGANARGRSFALMTVLVSESADWLGYAPALFRDLDNLRAEPDVAGTQRDWSPDLDLPKENWDVPRWSGERLVGEIDGKVWTMLKRLFAGEKTIWTSRSFADEAAFLRAVAQLSHLLPPCGEGAHRGWLRGLPSIAIHAAGSAAAISYQIEPTRSTVDADPSPSSPPNGVSLDATVDQYRTELQRQIEPRGNEMLRDAMIDAALGRSGAETAVLVRWDQAFANVGAAILESARPVTFREDQPTTTMDANAEPAAAVRPRREARAGAHAGSNVAELYAVVRGGPQQGEQEWAECLLALVAQTPTHETIVDWVRAGRDLGGAEQETLAALQKAAEQLPSAQTRTRFAAKDARQLLGPLVQTATALDIVVRSKDGPPNAALTARARQLAHLLEVCFRAHDEIDLDPGAEADHARDALSKLLGAVG